jgi:phosphate transport system substrate-binding protein
VVLTNQAGAAAWPISSATFVLVPKSAAKPGQSAEVLKFFDWAYGAKGDAMALGLDYVPMPDAVVAKVKAAWAQVKK